MGAISHAKAATSSAVGAPRIARKTGNAAKAARLPNSRGAMNARCRVRVSASYRADGCNKASMQSRKTLKKIVTALAFPLDLQKRTRKTPPLSFASTCQSEIKRTLRARGFAIKDRILATLSQDL